MEFQVNEAVELIKVLADTENLTLQEAFKVFVAESGLDVEYASQLKGALYERYTLKEMASDSLTNALMRVFVNGESSEVIHEVDTKETAEGTKYKVRVKDEKSGSTYTRFATREKIAELRSNPNIASVELTDYSADEDDEKGGDKEKKREEGKEKKAAKDYDGDGKVESGSKEHAGAVHNAIQKAKGGKADGQDTRREEVELDEAEKRIKAKGSDKSKKIMPDAGPAYYKKPKDHVSYKEEVEVEEGIDFKGAKRIDDAREKAQKEKDKKNPSGKDRRLMLRKFRPGASQEERAEGGRDSMREKGTIPKKNGKKMFESYLKLREENRKKLEEQSVVTEADIVDAGRENSAQRDRKKLTGQGVDNSDKVVLMPTIGEAVVTEHSDNKAVAKLHPAQESSVRDTIREMKKKKEEDCGCDHSDDKEEKKEKKSKLDEAGMPILEYSKNNATGPSDEMVDPPKDPEGEPGTMNPKGKPKRQKKTGETSGDRRPNDDGPDLPNELGTVPGGGCGC